MSHGKGCGGTQLTCGLNAGHNSKRKRHKKRSDQETMLEQSANVTISGLSLKL